ncbi:hypothetical protein [Tenacibaculum finnmarkense]|uniref:hypothetical protein n=1 Tax=Tenacibaculum finnmarkense TaxID=2781243 RepID=UPI001EFACAB0|nr:hypothetical protein [Tenacibaculum finnmarkense]MCG8796043.1 hypothetical protein [Tenacibaculum finnmarkense]MCG8798564.1 hypothetical protein [Tenacibaculum finnmarkense]
MDKELKNKIDFISNKAGSKTNFSVPENYFENIEATILSSIQTAHFSKKNSFKTPKNYFNTVDENILSTLNIKTSKEIKTISFYKKILQLIPVAVAASILLFIGLNHLTTDKKHSFDDITQADISYWYENGYGTSSNDELATILDAEDFDEDVFASINKENLEAYLNTIDNASFFNEIQ